MANTQTSLLQELSRAADSYDIRDHLSVLFQREVIEDSQRMHDYSRLSDQLIEGVNMRDEYINELRMLVNYEEIVESIEIMRRMQVDDMEKDSRLRVTAREIQTKVHEKNCFIVKLRGSGRYTPILDRDCPCYYINCPSKSEKLVLVPCPTQTSDSSASVKQGV
ncbi:hypothetical protein Tco_0394467 [Tanacetum coccineum]